MMDAGALREWPEGVDVVYVWGDGMPRPWGDVHFRSGAVVVQVPSTTTQVQFWLCRPGLTAEK